MTDEKMPANGLLYNGVDIGVRGERLNLTDMWRAAGGDPQQAPAKWRTLPQTVEFIDHVSLIIGKSDIISGDRGRHGSTTAHWQLGLAYAKYLSPDFHMWCNTVVRERMEGRVVPADDLLRRTDGTSRMLAHKVTGVERDLGSLAGVVSALVDQVQTLVIAHDPRVAVVDYQAPVEIIREHGVPPKGRRSFSRRVGNRLAWYSAEMQIPVKLCPVTGRRLFSISVADRWLRQEGLGAIAMHKAAVAGQTVLPFSARKPHR